VGGTSNSPAPSTSSSKSIFSSSTTDGHTSLSSVDETTSQLMFPIASGKIGSDAVASICLLFDEPENVASGVDGLIVGRVNGAAEKMCEWSAPGRLRSSAIGSCEVERSEMLSFFPPARPGGLGAASGSGVSVGVTSSISGSLLSEVLVVEGAAVEAGRR